MPYNFENLEVYKESLEFIRMVHCVSRKFPRNEIFGLTSQFKRAATSIALNIAEGSGGTKKEFKFHLTIARNSIYECVPIL